MFASTLPTMGRHLDLQLGGHPVYCLEAPCLLWVRNFYFFNSRQMGRHPAFCFKASCLLWVGIFLFLTASKWEGTLPTVCKHTAYCSNALSLLWVCIFLLKQPPHGKALCLLFEGTLPTMGRHLFI